MYRYSTGYTSINYNSDLSGGMIINIKPSASNPEPESISVPTCDVVKFVLTS